MPISRNFVIDRLSKRKEIIDKEIRVVVRRAVMNDKGTRTSGKPQCSRFEVNDCVSLTTSCGEPKKCNEPVV